jgi:osmotically-inducible protein OsmY
MVDHVIARAQMADATRLAERIEFTLRRSAYPQLWNVNAAGNEGGVRLTGTVRSYYMKQLAHATAVEAADGVQVENHVEVI